MELETAIARKFKLQDKFEQIDKKLERNLRFLKWQQKKSCQKNDKWFGKNCKTICMSEQPSNFINCTQLKIMENINSSMFNFNKTSPEIKNHHVTQDYKENKKNHMSLFDKIKTLQKNFKNDIGGKFGNQCLKQIGKFCHGTLRAQFYDQSFYDESKIVKENLKSLSLKLEKQLTKNIKNIKKVEKKNLMLSEQTVVYNIEEDDTDFFKDVKLFEKLFRGRAYQTMVMMAEIQMKPFLQSMECAGLQTSAHSSKPVAGYNQLQDDVLEFSTERYISRFFDTLSKESIRINEESKNAMTIELAEVTRTMREAREGNRRQLEQTRRKKQDEILKEVLKIHQDLSELFTEEFMKKAIEQCAEEEGLKLMREITSRTFSGDKFYNNKCTNIENELVYNTIIPEAYKIIHREDIY